MTLAELLQDVRVMKLFSGMYGRMVLTQDISVREIQYDSRCVEHGDMFVAIPGTAVDGHAYLGGAIERGAAVIVVQNDASVPDALCMHHGVLKVVVPDTRIALAVMAGTFYGHPSRRLRLIGVTGTNGKTTTTHLVRAILEAGGARVGLIGTIGYSLGAEQLPATHTTPESLELNKLLALMVERGCSAAVMEVSSHALALHRVHGLRFAAGVFTNLTQDHLDFHGSMEAYLQAKRMLFAALPADGVAVTNADDPAGGQVVDGTRARVWTYGVQAAADVRAREVRLRVDGMQLVLVHDGRSLQLEASLTGGFNVENILAASTTAMALGIPPGEIARGVRALRAVRGRLEQVVAPAGWTAVIDYAHTPDALEKSIRTLRGLLAPGTDGRIITVFGCGGNRDAGKRPIMGRIATDLSDVTIVTSDNPRKEDPQAIIAQILAGVVPGRTVSAEPDRRTAIRRALAMARRGDIVLVAGKGHEDYQVVGTAKAHFDDREEVETFIRDGQCT